MEILDFAKNAPDFFVTNLVPLAGKVPRILDFVNGVPEKDLFSRLASKKTDSVGIVCGIAPGYFYCIDVDEQHYPGIAEKVYDAYMGTEFYDDSRIVIETTPSGGSHYWFRCENTTGSVKLSSRPSFNPNTGKKIKECFIETRGKGGQFRTYPSEGCTPVTDWQYPEGMLSDEEFADIMHFFSSFNEWVEEEKKPFIPKNNIGDYEKTPFQAYNEQKSVYDLLKEAGWADAGQRGDKVYMTRPGKNKGISGTVFPGKNIFYCFTSSTEFDPGAVYGSVDVALMYKYANGKTMWADIKNDFGTLTETSAEVEAKKWLNKTLLEYAGGDLPTAPNTLPAAIKESSENLLKIALENYRFGIFWQDTGNKCVIDRERLYKSCVKMGYYNYKGSVVRIVRNPHSPVSGSRFIIHQDLTVLNKDLKAYANGGLMDYGDDADTSVVNSIDAFMEQHGNHLIKQLEVIPDTEFLGDTDEVFRRFFKDCWVEIDKEGIHERNYKELPEGLIPLNKYINFNYSSTPYKEYGLFSDYLKKSTSEASYALKAIAHLVHDYKSPAMSYMVGLIESTGDSQSIGGSGKNLLMGLISQITPVHHISGEMMKPDTSMLQSWKDQRLISIDDLPKRFSFDSLKELVTGSVLVKNLFRDERLVPYSDLPKVAFSTNHGVPTMRGDIRRRTRIIEFTDFFNKSGGVARHYATERGGLAIDWMFPSGNIFTLTSNMEERPSSRNCWNDEEWKHFFVTVFKAVQAYIAGGLELEEEVQTRKGWQKNFAHTYGDAELSYMEEKFDELVGATMSNADVYNHYVCYCSEAGIPQIYRKRDKAHLQALREWAKYNGIKIVEGVSVGMGQRGKSFLKDTGDDYEDEEIDNETNDSSGMGMPF